jgi:type II secretory pathway component PulF
MQLAYTFSAKTSVTGKTVAGVVFSQNLPMATYKVTKMGFTSPRLKVDWNLSLSSVFGLLRPTDFNLREKARLFQSLSKRITTDNNLVRALGGLQENVDDPFLRNAINVMMGSMLNGAKPEDAMQAAGFGQRDCKVVAALSTSGQIPKAFKDLATEADSEHKKAQAISKALLMPKVMTGLMYVATFLFLVFGAPRMTKFFKQLGGDFQLPWMIQWIYDVADIASKSPFVFGACWLAAGVALYASKVWGGWHDLWRKIPTWRALSEKAEQISVWSIYSIMYDAGIPPAQICRDLILTASSQGTKKALADLAKCFQTGGQDGVVIERSALPRFAIAAYKQAKESGDFSANLRDDVSYWRDDVEVLTDKLSAALQLMSLAFMAVIVLLAVSAFYLPVVLPTLTKF